MDLQPRPKNVSDDGYSHLVGDLLNEEWLRSAWPRRCDSVVHLVGLADAGRAQQEPSRSFELNVITLERVLEACREHPPRQIVVPSTAAVYGTTRELPINEQTPARPTGIYGWHKLIGESLVKAYAEAYHLNYTILRLFNVCGRGHKGIISLAVNAAIGGELFTVYGADQLRDFVYVGDVVDAFIKVIEHGQGCSRVINIGSGEGISVRQVVELVQEFYPDLSVRYGDGHNSTTYDSVADVSLAKSLLGWKPHDSVSFLRNIMQKEMIGHA